MGVSAGVFQSWIISKITNYRKPLRPTPFSKPNLQVDGLQDDATSPILIMDLCATAVLMGYQTLEMWSVIVFSFYILHYIWVDIYWVNILCIVSLYFDGVCTCTCVWCPDMGCWVRAGAGRPPCWAASLADNIWTPGWYRWRLVASRTSATCLR